MPTSVIGSVSVTPSQPRPGESVKVEVLGRRGRLLTGRGIRVSINGVPGAARFLQFPKAGTYPLLVTVAGQAREMHRTQLTVDGDPVTFRASSRTPPAIALLHAFQSQARSYEVFIGLGPTVAPPLPLATTQLALAPVLTRIADRTAIAAAAGRGPLADAVRRSAGGAGVAMRSAGSRQVSAAVFEVDGSIEARLGSVRNAIAARYEWDFGDGSSAITTSPFVRHDFLPAITPRGMTEQFDVTCRVAQDGVTVTRTLTVCNTYGICRQHGYVVPPTTGELFASRAAFLFQGILTVHNLEAVPLVLDRLAIVGLSDDPAAASTPESEWKQIEPIEVAPRSSSLLVTNATIDGDVAHDAPGFAVYYAGDADGLPVRVSHTFEIRAVDRHQLLLKPNTPEWRERLPLIENWPWERVEAGIDAVFGPGAAGDRIRRHDVTVDRGSGTLAVNLGPLAGRAASAGQGAVVARVVGALSAPMDELFLSTARLPASVVEPVAALPTDAERAAQRVFRRRRTPPTPPAAPEPPEQPMPVVEGGLCSPDNLTEAELAVADAQQLVCQITGETYEELVPARFTNARKGDVVLSPGGSGLIAPLLRVVDPPQWYSHTGLMTNNYYEITHSTAADDRFTKHPADAVLPGSSGVVPRVLKYAWPGVVVQGIEEAVHGEEFPDPEFPWDVYRIGPFSPHTVGLTHNGQFVTLSPLVVKPDPVQETKEIRTTLHGVADDARAVAGRPGTNAKSHYRFFCYTDPTIGLDTTAPADAGWAAGTFPSVCSSLIWRMLSKRGVHMESDTDIVMPSDLEPADTASGAFVAPGTPDGLYTYTAEERRLAAEWLFDHVHHLAFEEAGWFGEAVSDAADNIANQVVNVFARDIADDTDSDEWKQIKDANAISPDNILMWDAPTVNGLYGFKEPLQYTEPRLEKRSLSRWTKVLSRGTLTGRVSANGENVQGAWVQVYDGKGSPTDADGRYELLDVGFGSYVIKASKVIDGIHMHAEKSISLHEAEKTIDIELKSPADRYRLAQIYYDFYGRDDENWPWDDETLDPGPEYVELELGPDRPVNTHTVKKMWGGELKVTFTITVRLLVTNSIDVEVTGRLYEGAVEDNDDLDGQGAITFIVPTNETGASALTVTNTAEGVSDDRGELTIAVKNALNPAW